MRIPAAFVVVLALSSTIAGAQDAPAPVVTVVAIELADITPSATFTGRIEAIDKVDLIARVDGFLEQRPFIEGSMVDVDDLLFAIEKGPYEAQLGEVDAAIVAAKADYELAKLEADRQSTLVEREAAAQAVLDRANAEAEKALAAVQREEATRATALLDLGYTDIKAPIAGKIGRASVSVGDYVGPSNGALATIVSQNPMYVTFPVTERQLWAFRQREAASEADRNALSVKVRVANGDLYPHSGSIDFVDVQVNPGTDTVTLRARIANPDSQLIDQQLVTAVIETAELQSALLVPQQAVLSDQGGRFVLVVGSDDVVEQRSIEVGSTVAGSYVVTDGLEAGDLVITEGIQRARPGMVVDPAPAGGS